VANICLLQTTGAIWKDVLDAMAALTTKLLDDFVDGMRTIGAPLASRLRQ
jgi:hypothetical protein